MISHYYTQVDQFVLLIRPVHCSSTQTTSEQGVERAAEIFLSIFDDAATVHKHVRVL
jgi:hypothetical protein